MIKGLNDENRRSLPSLLIRCASEFYWFNKEVLDCLSAKQVYDDLERLSNGRDCVLLCYEKSSDFCHRHLVADWLSKQLNISVEEF